MRKKMKSFAAVAFLITLGIGITGFAAGAGAAEQAPPLTKQQVKELIKTAKTPEDHMKLAQYYRYEADELKSEAKDHEEMGAEYINHIVPKNGTMSQHCKDIAAYYAKAAQKAEEMASMQEEMAKSAGGQK